MCKQGSFTTYYYVHPFPRCYTTYVQPWISPQAHVLWHCQFPFWTISPCHRRACQYYPFEMTRVLQRTGMRYESSGAPTLPPDANASALASSRRGHIRRKAPMADVVIALPPHLLLALLSMPSGAIPMPKTRQNYATKSPSSVRHICCVTHYQHASPSIITICKSYR